MELSNDYITLMYICVNICAVAAINYIIVKLIYSSVSIVNRQYIVISAFSSIVFILTDTLWQYLSVYTTLHITNLYYFINTIYFISININYFTLVSYFAIYTDVFGNKTKDHLKFRFFSFGLATLLHVTNYWHKLIYRIDYVNDHAVYLRQPFYFLSTIVPFGSIAIIGICILAKNIKLRMAGKYFDNYDSIIKFDIYTSLAALTDLFQSIFPAYAIVLAFEFNCFYISELELAVSIDPLTKISNKREFIHNIKRNTEKIINGSDDNLYLIMIDANYFKEINDKYGHAEGDLALIRIADGLKRTCGIVTNNSHRILISRFGGDEFAVLMVTKDENKPKEFIDTLYEEMKKLKISDNAKYDISLACGYYKYENNMTIKDFIDLADNNLYENKKKYHIQHRK